MKKMTCIIFGVFLCLSCTVSERTGNRDKEAGDLWEILAGVKERPFVDLTHAFHPGIPHWQGFPNERREVLFTYEEDGFLAEAYTHVGQWGTHADPPSHFHRGLRTLDQIPPVEMLLPLVVIDVTEKVKKNPDYTLSPQDIEAWEKKNGRIPSGAFVAMKTGWSQRWPDQEAMQNRDDQGVAHYPGWSLEALKLLYEERGITASGHETTDTDPGIKTSRGNYEGESYILGQDHYQIELLANLDRVPEKGAIIICAFPKPKDGSGFPARVFAILP